MPEEKRKVMKMSDYEMARIEQHETRIQTVERKTEMLENSLSSLKFLVFCIICEVPIVGVIV